MPPKAVIKVSKKTKKVIKKQKTVDSDESQKPESPPPPPQSETTIENYINSLTKEEKKTMEIAKSHLGTSFNIKRSIGYINWEAEQTK